MEIDQINLMTVSQITDKLGLGAGGRERVAYAIRSRGIEPDLVAGTTRMYAPKTVDAIGKALTETASKGTRRAGRK